MLRLERWFAKGRITQKSRLEVNGKSTIDARPIAHEWLMLTRRPTGTKAPTKKMARARTLEYSNPGNLKPVDAASRCHSIRRPERGRMRSVGVQGLISDLEAPKRSTHPCLNRQKTMLVKHLSDRVCDRCQMTEAHKSDRHDSSPNSPGRKQKPKDSWTRSITTLTSGSMVVFPSPY